MRTLLCLLAWLFALTSANASEFEPAARSGYALGRMEGSAYSHHYRQELSEGGLTARARRTAHAFKVLPEARPAWMRGYVRGFQVGCLWLQLIKSDNAAFAAGAERFSTEYEAVPTRSYYSVDADGEPLVSTVQFPLPIYTSCPARPYLIVGHIHVFTDRIPTAPDARVQAVRAAAAAARSHQADAIYLGEIEGADRARMSAKMRARYLFAAAIKWE